MIVLFFKLLVVLKFLFLSNIFKLILFFINDNFNVFLNFVKLFLIVCLLINWFIVFLKLLLLIWFMKFLICLCILFGKIR